MSHTYEYECVTPWHKVKIRFPVDCIWCASNEVLNERFADIRDNIGPIGAIFHHDTASPVIHTPIKPLNLPNKIC